MGKALSSCSDCQMDISSSFFNLVSQDVIIMGEIASYYYIKGSRKCFCHLCNMQFKNKGAIRVHFQKSKRHWRLRNPNPNNQPTLLDFFSQEDYTVEAKTKNNEHFLVFADTPGRLNLL